MKLKSWMDIVRARRGKKKDSKNKEKEKEKEKDKAKDKDKKRKAETTTHSDSAPLTKLASADAFRPEVIGAGVTTTTATATSGAFSANIRSKRKLSNPSTTFLRCGESVSASPSPHTPPYLSVSSSANAAGYDANLDRRTSALPTAITAIAHCSPATYRHAQQQPNGLCQCFGSLGLGGGGGDYGSPLRHAAFQGSPRPGISVPHPSQHHLQEQLQDAGSVNLNSPRQRSKIRTNPWLLTPKVSRVDSSSSAQRQARPLLPSMSTSSESCSGSQRDSFVSSGGGGCTTDGDHYEGGGASEHRFPTGPFTSRSARRRNTRNGSGSDDDTSSFLTVRGRPLRELVAGTSCSLPSGGQLPPPIRQCSYLSTSTSTSTPKKGATPSSTPKLLRPDPPPLRKRSLRSSRNRSSHGVVHRSYGNNGEEEEDESDECDTLNEMGNFSEHYNAYFDRETDILGDEDERDPYVKAGRVRATSARGSYYRPPPYAEQPRRPPRDLLRGNDDDYSEKLEFVDVDEAFSEMSGCGSLEEEEEEEEGMGDGDGGVEFEVDGRSRIESERIRIRIRREQGSDKTLHLFGTEGEGEGEDEDEEGCEPRTPDSAFPSSESELSSLMAAGSCCSAGSTPQSEWRTTACSSGASDSGRSTIHEASVSAGPGSSRSSTASTKCRQLVVAAEGTRESLEDKVRWLQLERLVVREKIREAREEERARHLDRERFRHELALHRRQLLLRTLHELRLKMDEQSMRLQEAYQVTLHAHHQHHHHHHHHHHHQQQQQQQQSRRRQRETLAPVLSATTAAERRRSWEIVGRLM